jgi:transposase
MGHAIPVLTDYTAGEVRRYAQRAKDAAQARRLLAIAAVLDGASREEAAKIGGMDRQTLRDWVIRFNEQGADGLINIPSPGMPPKLNAIHKAFLVYRALKNLGFSHMSAQPEAYKQNAEATDAFKKTSPSVWRKSAQLAPDTPVEVWFQDEMRVGGQRRQYRKIG